MEDCEEAAQSAGCFEPAERMGELIRWLETRVADHLFCNQDRSENDPRAMEVASAIKEFLSLQWATTPIRVEGPWYQVSYKNRVSDSPCPNVLAVQAPMPASLSSLSSWVPWKASDAMAGWNSPGKQC